MSGDGGACATRWSAKVTAIPGEEAPSPHPGGSPVARSPLVPRRDGRRTVRVGGTRCGRPDRDILQPGNAIEPPVLVRSVWWSRSCPWSLALVPGMAPRIPISFDVRVESRTKMTSARAISLHRQRSLSPNRQAAARRSEPVRPDRHQLIERAAGGSRSHPRQTDRSSNGLATATSTRSRRSCVSGWMACTD